MTNLPPDTTTPDHDGDDEDSVDDHDVHGAILQVPLSPQHFGTFVAVVDAGGRLSGAALELGLSQPGITHQLNELERRLGMRLLDRARGRPARLTRPGRVFDRYARSILQLQAAMYADLEQVSRKVGGHMRVGSSPGPGEHWLPPLLMRFRDEFPDLHIELHVADARSIVEQVFDHELELGFVGGRWTRPGLDFEPIWNDEFVLVAAPAHELVGREGLRLKDLAGADFVTHEPGTGLRMTLEQELGDRGLSLDHFNVLAELGNQESVKSAVAAGYGVGCVWRQSVEAEVELGRLCVLDVAGFHPESQYWAVRRSSRRLSRRGQVLLAFLQRERDEHLGELRRRRAEEG